MARCDCDPGFTCPRCAEPLPVQVDQAGRLAGARELDRLEAESFRLELVDLSRPAPAAQGSLF